MKRTIFLTAALLLVFTSAASGQVPTDQDEMGRPIRDTFEVLVDLPDVPEGSTCSIGDLNNQSTYRPGVVIPNTNGQIDRGNILRIETGRGGEHDTDWKAFPVERVEGAETIGEFVAGGDGFGNPAPVVVWVGFDWHHSIDDLSVVCTPPPTATTTTTTTTTTSVPPETTTTVATTTTTQPPPETASTVRPPETTTTVDPCPDKDALACTGTSSGVLASYGLALTALGAFVLVVRRIAGEV